MIFTSSSLDASSASYNNVNSATTQLSFPVLVGIRKVVIPSTQPLEGQPLLTSPRYGIFHLHTALTYVDLINGLVAWMPWTREIGQIRVFLARNRPHVSVAPTPFSVSSTPAYDHVCEVKEKNLFDVVGFLQGKEEYLLGVEVTDQAKIQVAQRIAQQVPASMGVEAGPSRAGGHVLGGSMQAQRDALATNVHGTPGQGSNQGFDNGIQGGLSQAGGGQFLAGQQQQMNFTSGASGGNASGGAMTTPTLPPFASFIHPTAGVPFDLNTSAPIQQRNHLDNPAVPMWHVNQPVDTSAQSGQGNSNSNAYEDAAAALELLAGSGRGQDFNLGGMGAESSFLIQNNGGMRSGSAMGGNRAAGSGAAMSCNGTMEINSGGGGGGVGGYRQVPGGNAAGKRPLGSEEVLGDPSSKRKR